MREILFRGKSVYNEEWYFGDLLTHEDATHDITEIRDFENRRQSPVFPETIGQYTGLTDKNGKKIFEGDIVRHYNIDELPEEFEIGKIFFSEEQCCFKRTCNQGFSSCYISADCKYEVNGNIYDNPELLKVPADG